MTNLPIVAAIANYNMAKELSHLLPQVTKQGYDAIFVLDDASTDNSRQVVSEFRDIVFVAGRTNKGAGGNRNRIINALKHDAIIHFLDADVDLETDKTASLVRKVVPDEPFGFVGGLIKTSGGVQNPWNYGSGPGLRYDIGAQLQLLIGSQTAKHPKLAKRLRRWFKRILADWPDPLAKPVRRRIGWAAEANIVFRSDIFASFGGFDESFRETEILDLSLRMRQQGLKCYFDPLLVVRHTEGKVRNYNRNALKLKELIRVTRNYGLINWLVAGSKTTDKP